MIVPDDAPAGNSPVTVAEEAPADGTALHSHPVSNAPERTGAAQAKSAEFSPTLLMESPVGAEHGLKVNPSS